MILGRRDSFRVMTDWTRTERIDPYVDDAILAARRRTEAALALIGEYEAEHGLITEDELRQLDSEWLP